MKQVIIRVRDCRQTYTKTIKSFYFYSVKLQNIFYNSKNILTFFVPMVEFESTTSTS